MAKYIFGIDLGTTYSCISYVDESGRTVVVKNRESKDTTPSVVNFADPKHVSVGEIAKSNAIIDPENTVSCVKRLMGKTDNAGTFHGEKKSPEEVSSYILRKLTEDASKILDTEVKDVVITCPAYFGTEERTATKNAGIIAGLNVIEIISEPTAAALFYGCSKEHEDKTILVYDLGGGTFDVTIMGIHSGNIEVIASDGNHELGGKDWDSKLIDYILEEFEKQTGKSPDLEPDEEQDLSIKAENAKIQLTLREKTDVSLRIGRDKASIEITKEKFNEITEDLLQLTLSKTDDAIKAANETKKKQAEEAKANGSKNVEFKEVKIDEILLVGGSTNMPQVEEALQKKYGETAKIKILDPDQAVAKGAAIYALGAFEAKAQEVKEKIKSGNIDSNNEEIKFYLEPAAVSTSVIPALHGKSMQEVVTVATTKSYGVALLVPMYDENGKVQKVIVNGVEKIKRERKCVNMILKNEPMPDGVISKEQDTYTSEDRQPSVKFEIFESDITDEIYEIIPDFLLGSAILELPQYLPEGSLVTLELILNKEGILELTGIDQTSKKEVHATLHASKGSTMSQDAVFDLRSKSQDVAVE